MRNNSRIQEVIFRAVEELNEQLPDEQRLEKTIDTILFGRSGKLDSLGLVNLIVTTEQILEDELGIEIVLADEKAISQRTSPFRTIGTLADYITSRIEEKSVEK